MSDNASGNETKLCEDCEHLSELLFCISPENGLSMVNGKPKPLFAAVQRSAFAVMNSSGTGICGPEAKHFSQKTIPNEKTTWWRFLK